MKNKIIIILFVLFSSYSFGQKIITWKDLAQIKYTEKYFPQYDGNFLYPEFSPNIKSLEGTTISIAGYFLDIDPNGKLFILSKNPMASCFFCGMGGPETAIEIVFKTKPKLKTDDVVMITGTLKLNKDDVEHFNYILDNCEYIFAN